MFTDTEQAPAQQDAQPSSREAVVRAVLDEIRPALQRDGGDCEFLEINGRKVMIRLTGACVFCKLASATLEGIQSRLVERLGEFVTVVPVAGAPRARH